MNNTQNFRNYEETGVYSTGAIEQGLREGRRLRSAAMRNLFGRVRSSFNHH